MSIVYQRKTIEYEDMKIAPENVKKLRQMLLDGMNPQGVGFDWYSRWNERGLPTKIWGKPDNFYTSTGVIVFCGKVFRYISLKRDVLEMSPTSSKHYFYDAESALEFCDKNKLKIDQREHRWSKSTVRDVINKKFDKDHKVTLDVDWLIENKVICATLSQNGVIINPPLKPKQFFKVMDAYAAYGELDMWICGTLAFPQNEMVMLDDKSLIAKHGFDKWSFRKQPEGYDGKN